MESHEPTEQLEVAYKRNTGYGSVQAVIYSSLSEFEPPESGAFYNFTESDLLFTHLTCISLCMGCGVETLGFQSEGHLEHTFRTQQNPVEVAGKRVTPIMEGMHQHQEFLDKFSCDCCGKALRAGCSDY